MLTVYTFGDSILDSGRYNEYGINPGQLILQNDNRLFPEFVGRGLTSILLAQLDHRAQDGATVSRLVTQAVDLPTTDDAIALLTIGGNDLLGGLVLATSPELEAFATTLDRFLGALPVRPVLIANVYDPTFGDDSRNFLGIDPTKVRTNHRRVNDILETAGTRYGAPVDLHGHFLSGKPDWFTHTIEPSLIGTSEVRRVFLRAIESTL